MKFLEVSPKSSVILVVLDQDGHLKEMNSFKIVLKDWKSLWERIVF